MKKIELIELVYSLKPVSGYRGIIWSRG